MAVSPHGSRTMGLIRRIAGVVFTDKQRKALKAVLIGIRWLPLKILGAKGVFDTQSREMNRLKSRQNLLDGKFNLAIHGVPTPGPFTAELVSNSLLHRMEPTPGLRRMMERARAFDAEAAREAWDAFSKEIPSPQNGTDRRSVLVLNHDGPVEWDWLSDHAGSAESICWVDPSPDRRMQAEEKMISSGADGETLATDPLTALLSLQAREFDTVLFAHSLQSGTGMERMVMADELSRRVRTGGLLFVSIPSGTGASAGPRSLLPLPAESLNRVLFPEPVWKHEKQIQLKDGGTAVLLRRTGEPAV